MPLYGEILVIPKDEKNVDRSAWSKFPIMEKTVTFGSSLAEVSDIRINLKDVSPTHCRLIVQKGQYYLENNASFIGARVKLNQAIVPPKQKVPVKNDDVVWIGSRGFIFRSDVRKTKPSDGNETDENSQEPGTPKEKKRKSSSSSTTPKSTKKKNKKSLTAKVASPSLPDLSMIGTPKLRDKSLSAQDIPLLTPQPMSQQNLSGPSTPDTTKKDKGSRLPRLVVLKSSSSSDTPSKRVVFSPKVTVTPIPKIGQSSIAGVDCSCKDSSDSEDSFQMEQVWNEPREPWRSPEKGHTGEEESEKKKKKKRKSSKRSMEPMDDDENVELNVASGDSPRKTPRKSAESPKSGKKYSSKKMKKRSLVNLSDENADVPALDLSLPDEVFDAKSPPPENFQVTVEMGDDVDLMSFTPLPTEGKRAKRKSSKAASMTPFVTPQETIEDNYTAEVQQTIGSVLTELSVLAKNEQKELESLTSASPRKGTPSSVKKRMRKSSSGLTGIQNLVATPEKPQVDGLDSDEVPETPAETNKSAAVEKSAKKSARKSRSRASSSAGSDSDADLIQGPAKRRISTASRTLSDGLSSESFLAHEREIEAEVSDVQPTVVKSPRKSTAATPKASESSPRRVSPRKSLVEPEAAAMTNSLDTTEVTVNIEALVTDLVSQAIGAEQKTPAKKTPAKKSPAKKSPKTPVGIYLEEATPKASPKDDGASPKATPLKSPTAKSPATKSPGSARKSPRTQEPTEGLDATAEMSLEELPALTSEKVSPRKSLRNQSMMSLDDSPAPSPKSPKKSIGNNSVKESPIGPIGSVQKSPKKSVGNKSMMESSMMAITPNKPEEESKKTPAKTPRSSAKKSPAKTPAAEILPEESRTEMEDTVFPGSLPAALLNDPTLRWPPKKSQTPAKTLSTAPIGSPMDPSDVSMITVPSPKNATPSSTRKSLKKSPKKSLKTPSSAARKSRRSSLDSLLAVSASDASTENDAQASSTAGEEGQDTVGIQSQSKKSPRRRSSTGSAPIPQMAIGENPVVMAVEKVSTPAKKLATPAKKSPASVKKLAKLEKPASSAAKTPKERKSVSYAGVKRLNQTPKDDSPTMSFAGLRETLRTPRERKSTDFTGVRETLRTPKGLDTTVALGGLKETLRTPSQDLDATVALGGVKEIMRTPREMDTTVAFVGLKETLRGETRKSAVGVENVRQLLREEKAAPSPRLGGLRAMMRSPRKSGADKVDMVGVREMFQEEKNGNAEEFADGMENLFATPKQSTTPGKSSHSKKTRTQSTTKRATRARATSDVTVVIEPMALEPTVSLPPRSSRRNQKKEEATPIAEVDEAPVRRSTRKRGDSQTEESAKKASPKKSRRAAAATPAPVETIPEVPVAEPESTTKRATRGRKKQAEDTVEAESAKLGETDSEPKPKRGRAAAKRKADEESSAEENVALVSEKKTRGKSKKEAVAEPSEAETEASPPRRGRKRKEETEKASTVKKSKATVKFDEPETEETKTGPRTTRKTRAAKAAETPKPTAESAKKSGATSQKKKAPAKTKSAKKGESKAESKPETKKTARTPKNPRRGVGKAVLDNDSLADDGASPVLTRRTTRARKV